METRMTVAAVGGGILGWVNAFTVSLFNVPLNVIILAAAGCLLSYAYEGHPEHIQKKKFYFSVLANTFVASAAVSVAPQFLGWGWYSDKMQGSVAFLFALSARFAIPFFFKMMPEIIRRWFRIGEYKDAEASGDYRGMREFDEQNEEYERLPDDFK